MNPIEESIYQYINNIIEISEEQEPLLIQYCRMFSAVITGSFYVLDISKKRFIYIKPDDLLLCGYSVKEAMKLNFDLLPQNQRDISISDLRTRVANITQTRK